MTPQEVRDARFRMGYSARGLAGRLCMGSHGGRQVRRWEAGGSISGPAASALQLLLWLHAHGIDDPYPSRRDFRRRTAAPTDSPPSGRCTP